MASPPLAAAYGALLVRRLLARLVVGDRGLERAIFDAAEHAERVEPGEVLLGLLRSWSSIR